MRIRTTGTLGVLAGIALLLCLPGAAYADVSSLDAYAGEAAVLGKPRHHHRHPGSRSTASPSQRGFSLSSNSTGGAGAKPGGTGGPTGQTDSSSMGTSSSRSSSPASGGSAKGTSPAPARSHTVADSSTAGASLTGTDVAALVVLAILLLGGGILIRRLSRGSSSPSGPIAH